MARSFQRRRTTGLGLFVVLASACAGAPSDARGTHLLVATTGDHPPFSVLTDSSYVGVSIDLAHDLGSDIQRPVRFVRTTWTTLISDAAAGHFDVALSGIQVTQDRQAAAVFSDPYMAVGKRAVVRCSDLGRFSSLEDINRPGVRILTTASGTVEFARDNFPSTITIQAAAPPVAFERLLNREGDVVFADLLHSAHYVDAHPRLCLGLGGVVVGEYPIAVLMPPGSPLIDSVNRWIRKRRIDGFVQQVLETHSASAAGRML